MKKILVVEDEQVLRDAYVSILLAEGFEVTYARDGAEALLSLRESKPDLILLDILMPKLDGIEFMKKSKLKQKYPKIKVITFSNLSDTERLDEITKLGSTINILKSSYTPKQLVSTVKKLLVS